MCHLVRRQIVKDEPRRQDKPPRERERPCRRTRAPSADLVAHRDTDDFDVECVRVTAARTFKIVPCLALEKIRQPPMQMRRGASNAQYVLAIPGFDPDSAAHVGPVTYAMHDAAQG